MTTKEMQLKADALRSSVLACAALAEGLAHELEAHESNLASVLKRIVDVSGDAAFLERDLFHDAVAALSGSVAGIPATAEKRGAAQVREAFGVQEYTVASVHENAHVVRRHLMDSDNVSLDDALGSLQILEGSCVMDELLEDCLKQAIKLLDAQKNDKCSEMAFELLAFLPFGTRIE